MQGLELVQEQINTYIEELNHTQSTHLFSLLSQGKMLRSKLILKIANINSSSIKLCAIVEMIQIASLLHDDVIDDATTRRGKPSINKLFDSKTSIMFGDILYSKAFTQLTTMDKQIAFNISNSVTDLSIGEMLDVTLGEELNTSFDKYIDMINKKTASLIEQSSRCAAILANKDETKFASYGKNLGIAFQMVDDILDITQDSKTLGKPSMHDFTEGKVTIPYIYLFQRLNKEDNKYLKSLYKKVLNTNDILWIKDKMKITNALSDAAKLANEYSNKALKSISVYNDKELEGIILTMINRAF